MATVLSCINEGSDWAAAVVFGLAVHWRLYPVIYALPIALSLASRIDTRQDDRRNPGGDSSVAELRGGIRRTLRGLLSVRVVGLGVISASIVLGLGLLFFQLYGWEFVQVQALSMIV